MTGGSDVKATLSILCIVVVLTVGCDPIQCSLTSVDFNLQPGASTTAATPSTRDLNDAMMIVQHVAETFRLEPWAIAVESQQGGWLQLLVPIEDGTFNIDSRLRPNSTVFDVFIFEGIRHWGESKPARRARMMIRDKLVDRFGTAAVFSRPNTPESPSVRPKQHS